jgi:hypothetical protein
MALAENTIKTIIWEKTFINHFSDDRPISTSRIYKELPKLSGKEKTACVKS